MQGNAQGERSPKSWAWKTRRAEFCEFLQLAGLEAWSFKGQQTRLG